jgi:hypothetical protein
MRLLGIVASLIAALFVGALAAIVIEMERAPSYSIAQPRDAATIWRLDDRTGQVSVCGASLSGRELAQADMQLSTHIRQAGRDAKALAALGPEIDDLDNLARPRCSPWSAPEGEAVRLDLR